jgi:YbgC/YbaW family acyl-CoA thioester hydrolase
MIENCIERRIMWGDLDPLGIVFYPRFYEWIDACGHLFFEKINLNMMALWRDKRIAFGLVETSCRYFKPGKYLGIIRITTSIDTLEERTVLLRHNIRASNDALMAEGLEKRICLDVSDPENFRAIYIPPDIYNVLESAKDGGG